MAIALPDLSVLDDVDEQVWPVLDQLARAMRRNDPELGPTLDAIVHAGVEMIRPAEYAGLVLVAGNALEPVATVGAPVKVLDQWQRARKGGPCIDAAEQQRPITIRDTTTERRWEGFGDQAASLGVRSIICLPLHVDRERLGTLSFYASGADAFNAHHEQIAALFATHAALALAEARRLNQIRQALRSRQLIGQATGIVMERHRLTADSAFAVLVGASQAMNRKLVAVAEHLIETGELPDQNTQLYRTQPDPLEDSPQT